MSYTLSDFTFKRLPSTYSWYFGLLNTMKTAPSNGGRKRLASCPMTALSVRLGRKIDSGLSFITAPLPGFDELELPARFVAITEAQMLVPSAIL